ncbi:MAG: CofH family radical SAM protein [Mucinivorans sp.]
MVNFSFDEALELYLHAPLAELMAAGDGLRRELHPNNVVTWQIDRNVNITNVCVSGCKFCNFHCKPHQKEIAYITTMELYREKIEQTLALGGDQLLLQGGMHPNLGINYYETLFRQLKKEYPTLRLHALGPPEVAYLADKASISDRQALERLIAAGLDSLPGAGAEILDTQVRRRISPAKCSAERWLTVMAIAHQLGLATSATMMYGHIETPKQRIEHLFKIKALQEQRPTESYGFLAFIAWPYQGHGTILEQEGVSTNNSTIDYLRLTAIARLVLTNVPNIQASWLTIGVPAALMALHGGANDMGSIMIEENVVSAAGAHHTLNKQTMPEAISNAGFHPEQRNQLYQKV